MGAETEMEAGKQQVMSLELVGKPTTELPTKACCADDDECVCCSCRSKPLCGDGLVCCCCCHLHWSRGIELAFLLFVWTVTLIQYGPLWKWGFYSRNRWAGPLFSFVTLVYLPATITLCILGSRGVGFGPPNLYFKWDRFRIVTLVFSGLAWLLLIMPVLVLIGQASGLEAAIEAEFGKFSPVRPTTSAMNVVEWMFLSPQAWGPYGSMPGDFVPETFTYIEGIERKPNFTGFCQDVPTVRPWASYQLLDFYRPRMTLADGALWPMIFFVHGGSWGGQNRKFINWSIAYFLERGYAVVSSDYNYACDGYTAEDMTAQMRASLNYVVNNSASWGADGKKIFVMGESAGGHLALMMAYTLNATNSACGDWRSCGIKLVFEHYGPKEQTPVKMINVALAGGDSQEAIDKAFPSYYVNSNVPPTVTYHGTWDLLVGYQQSVRFHEKLQAAGVKHHLITLGTYNHVCENGYYGMPAQIQRFALERILALDKI